MFSCLFNMFGCMDEVKRSFNKGNRRRSSLAASSPREDTPLESDDEIHGLTTNDYTNRRVEDSHHGMTDEEYARMLQQQEYFEDNQHPTSNNNTNNNNTAFNTNEELLPMSNNVGTGTGNGGLREEQDFAYLQSLRRDQEKERQEQLERQRKENEERELRLKIQEKVNRRKEKANRLKIEPNENINDGVAKILFRLPDSTRVSRRFNFNDTINDIFDYLDVTYELDIENYCLVTSYPARRFTVEEHGNMTLKELQLDQRQLALMISEK
ncbi:hypothetical protein ABK040_012386 [Willaertia magna]